MQRQIGSEFSISVSTLFRKKTDIFRYSTGRDALYAILSVLKKKEKNPFVLLPAYLCESMLEPFYQLQVPFYFYKVSKDLKYDFEHIISFQKPSAILLIHYFGFIQPTDQLLAFCKKNNIFLIEDLAHAALSNYTPQGDFWYTSHRKLIPLVDGCHSNIQGTTNHSLSHNIFVLQRLCGMLFRPYFPTLSYRLLSHCEKKISRIPRPAPASSLSQRIYSACNPEEVVSKRRSHYSLLLQFLKKIALFPTLPPEVCPLGFPIVVKTSLRDKLRRYLIAHAIYPPIHWNLPGVITFQSSRKLSMEIMTLPCDQRYTHEDMMRIIQTIKEFDAQWNLKC